MRRIRFLNRKHDWKRASTIMLHTGPVGFMGDKTYVVALKTLERLKKARIPFEFVTEKDWLPPAKSGA